MATVDRKSLEKRPGILIIGPPNVGKRTLLSRLLALDFEDAFDSSSDVLSYGWTINTKYYTADVSLWMAHLHGGFSIDALPAFDQLNALVMIFDTSDLSSFAALKEWVSHTEIRKFDILLCMGNKVDLLPGHLAHFEYKKRLHKLEESWENSCPAYSDYGISETDGSSLLGDEESSSEIKRSCMEWCIEHNIEYVEVCASNADFDKCLSVDDDSQGVERLLGALSAHIWPGMILKTGDKITEPTLPERQESSDEEPDYEVEYEVLSAGSAEPWDDTDVGWISASSSVTQNHNNTRDYERGSEIIPSEVELQPSTSTSQKHEEIDSVTPGSHDESDEASDIDVGKHYNFNDLDQLMSEIGNIRENLRLMPDFQRKEMAANLAMKMAGMFGDSSDNDERSNN